MKQTFTCPAPRAIVADVGVMAAAPAAMTAAGYADLAAKIPGCKWFPTFEEVARYVADNAESGDMIITLGCGDVYKVAFRIEEMLKEKYGE